MRYHKKDIFLWIFIPLAFIIGINILLYEPPTVKRKDISFNFENAELIFFRNLRAFFYQPKYKGHIEVHTLKKLQELTPPPPFIINIVIDPQTNKAFITPKLSTADTILLTKKSNTGIDSLLIFEGNIMERYQQAATLYDWVRSPEAIQSSDFNTPPQEVSNQAKDAYRKTLKDYFKLVNAIH